MEKDTMRSPIGQPVRNKLGQDLHPVTPVWVIACAPIFFVSCDILGLLQISNTDLGLLKN